MKDRIQKYISSQGNVGKGIILCHVVAEGTNIYFAYGNCIVASCEYILSCEQYRNILIYQSQILSNYF